MRNVKMVQVSHGNVDGTGRNKKEANADLASKLEWLAGDFIPHIESRFGLILIIARTSTGWTTQVFNPTEAKHGEAQRFTSFEGMNGWCEVLESLRFHAAQNAWTHDTNDAEHVAAAGLVDKASELTRWIAFQRRYRAAKENGESDSTAFDIATRTV